jgi:hypothetical protein
MVIFPQHVIRLNLIEHDYGPKRGLDGILLVFG